jgi:3,4-dehydroadipyl-CoA semialdehyde dehydrogenase
VSLLAGVPVVAKPASSTALLAHAMVKDVIAAKVLPDGALSLICGGAGDLLDALGSDDVVAFTGSADTARRVRGHANVVNKSVPVNIEADSINAALLAPGSSPGSAAFDAFVREVVREMTVKAGQKCTAIRRIFVAAAEADAVAEALAAKLKATKVGDPRAADTRMGPLVTRGQQAAAFEGIRRLASEASIVCGGADAPALDGIDGASRHSWRRPCCSSGSAGAGSACTRSRSSARRNRRALSRRAGGRRAGRARRRLAGRFGLRRGSGVSRAHGRARSARATDGCSWSIPSIAAPIPATASSCRNAITAVPGAPGRARSWAGLYGLRFYHQRLAVQGSSDLLAELQQAANARGRRALASSSRSRSVLRTISPALRCRFAATPSVASRTDDQSTNLRALQG